MDNDLGTLSVGIALETAGLAAGLSGARDLLGGFAGLATTALVGVGAASITMAGNFEQGVNRLRTGAGDVQDSFASLSSGILKVSTATGEMSGPLTKAMYEILSSGQRGAQAFDTLAAAAKGAQIEQANVVDVSDTLTGSMTNFGTKVFNATDYMNGLVTAVSRGRITLQDLSTAMGPIEPVAHAMGISFSDLSAAMSTQTNAAIPAERAATGLRFMMQSLEVPTKKAKDAMTEWGLSSVAVADEMKVSLPGALQMIYDAAKRAGPEGSVPFDRAISDMVGGQRSLGAFLALTGDHMKAFKDNADAIAASMKSGAGDVQGWALAQSNFNIKLDEAKAAVEALGIKIGMALLPIAGQLLDKVSPLVQRFSDWAGTGNNLQGVLSVVGGVIKSDVIDPAVKLWNAVEPIITDFEKWNEKTHFLQNTLQDVGGFINTVAGYVANNLVPPIRSLIGHLEEWLTKSNFVHDALGTLGGVIGAASQAVGTLVGWVSSIVGWFAQSKPAADLLKDALIGIGVAIAGIKLVEFAQSIAQAAIKFGSSIQDFGQGIGKLVNGDIPGLKMAVADVGTTAKTTMVQGVATGTAASRVWFTGLEATIDETKAAEVGIGTTMKTTVAADVGTGALASEASIARVGAEAEATAATTKIAGIGMGASFLGLLGPIALVATIAIPMIGAALQQSKETMDKFAADFKANVDANMLPPIRSFGNLADQIFNHAALAAVQGFTTGAVKMLQGLDNDYTGILQSMDKSTQLYWNQIANVVDAYSAQAVDDANRNFARIHNISPGIYNSNFNDSSGATGHALGGSNLPAGISYVAGERGPELITPSGSTNVYTASQTAAMRNGGQSSGPTTIVLEIDGRQFAAATVEHIAPAIVNRMRLRAAVRM